jgi:hypothetical protein
MEKPKAIEPGNYDGLIVNPAYVLFQNELLPLDFFCTKGSGVIGWAIRRITKNLSSDRECKYNHAGLLPDGTACTLEALWHVESKNLFEHYEGQKVLIARYIGLTPKKYLKAIKSIQRHIDQPYPKRRLFFHLLNLAHHIHWTNAVVCSELVAKALFNAGARHHNYWGTTPDNIADEIKNQLNKKRTGPNYKIIYKNKLPWLMYSYCTYCKEVYFIPTIEHCYVCRKKFDNKNEERIPNKKIRDQVILYNELKIIHIANAHKGEIQDDKRTKR